MRSFLDLCAEKGFLEPIKMIPNHDHAINAMHIEHYAISPLLVVAVGSMELETVSLLLCKGARPVPAALCEAAGLCKHTPRSTKPTCNHIGTEILLLLLDVGVDPNAREQPHDDSLTPLHYAASSGCPKAIKVLLAAGANPNPQGAPSTPLYSVCAALQVEAVEILLEHGADLTVRGQHQYTVLHGVANAVASLPPADLRKLISLLVRESSLLESRKRSELTPLALACKHGKVAVAVELLGFGADPSARCKEGRTALHWLAAKSDMASDAEIEAVVALMVKAGVDPLARGSDGKDGYGYCNGKEQQ
ncbi:hypothetical protein HDU96_004403, partial [Phlyctochytrium bullatum]